ncbi:hypothetical protein EVAR_69669_1 [Eumeta japonica]|uniref:Uncharacterized protein n=1 Tax=Eumeta variegata TaxID=151549 RepID=A0A4C1ZT28_EUMVA|nr:hypothetical protein EVAR_69669_1 [Eumeta japonica]
MSGEKRDTLLVNLALNQKDSVCSCPNTSKRQDTNTKVCTSMESLRKRQARSLSSLVECTPEIYVSDSQNPVASQDYNPLIDVTSYDINKSHDMERKQKITIPVRHKNSELYLTLLEKSVTQLTSTSGPLRTWIDQSKIFNPKVLAIDLEENENTIPCFSRDSENQPSCSSTSNVAFIEAPLKEIPETPRRRLLQILEEPDENFDDYILDDDFFGHNSESDLDNGSTSENEENEELVPNAEDGQEWSNQNRLSKIISFVGNRMGLKMFILKMIVYAGAGDTEVGGANHAAKVVTNVLQDYVNKVEMRSLRSICEVSRKDRRRSSDVREQCRLKEGVVTGVERGVLLCFGYLEKMN